MELEFLLPEFFKCHHPSLRILRIQRNSTCNSFLSFPLGNFPMVHRLTIDTLKGFEFLSISTSDSELPSFCESHLRRGPNLVSICCKNMKAACFQSLKLDDCPELIFPIQGLPSTLTSLSTMRCNKFTYTPGGVYSAKPAFSYLTQNFRSSKSHFPGLYGASVSHLS